MKDLEVRYVKGGLGRNNPARVNLDTGVVEVNANLFRHYSPLQRELVLQHEAGHVYHDTVDNEELADRYALEQVAGTVQYSLRRSVDGLLEILEKANVPEERKKELIISALQIDAERFGNEHAKALLEELKKDSRIAGAIGVVGVMAIIGAAISLFELLRQTIIGRRADWFIADLGGKKKTQYKINLLQDACDSVGAKAIKQKATSLREDGGELLVYEQLDDDDWVYNEVHTALYPAFKDNNIFTPSFFRSRDKFYKKCSWVKDWINEYMPTVREHVRDEYNKQGYSDPNGSGGASGLSIASGSSSLLRYVLIGLVLLFIIKKVF